MPLLALPLITTVACTIYKKSDEQVVKQETGESANSDANVVNVKKVNYVALGDSIAAGFNPDLGGFSAPGKLNANGELSGLSYPAFLAQYIQKINPHKLGSFENFGLSGTKTQDWLYLLGDPNAQYEASGNILEALLEIDKVPNNPYIHQIQRQFKNFGRSNAKDLNYFRNKVKTADLITISLGANDIKNNLPIELILFFLANEKSDWKNEDIAKLFSTKITKAQNEITESLAELKTNLAKVVQKVKELNGKASINLISYPMPFIRMAKYFNSFIQNKQINNWLTKALNDLNNTIKEVAQSENVNFIDAYDVKNWTKSPEKYAKYFYDLHPTTKGYKKMAQDILLKMLSKEKINPNWDNTFVINDRDVRNTTLEFENTELEKVAQTILNSQDFNSMSKLESEAKIVKTMEQYKNVGDLTNMVMFYLAVNKDNLLKIAESPFLNNTLRNIFGKYYFELQVFFILNQSLILDFLNSFISSGYMDTVFSQMQEVLDTIDLDKNKILGTQNISWEIIRPLFKQKAFNVNNMFLFTKSLLKSSAVAHAPKTVTKLFTILLNTMLFNNSITLEKTYFNSKTTTFKEYNNELDKLNNELTNKFTPLAQDLIAKAEEYSGHTSFISFLKAFLTNNEQNIKEVFNVLITKSLNMPKIISPILKDFLAGLNIPFNKKKTTWNLTPLAQGDILRKIQTALYSALKNIPDGFNGTFDELYAHINKTTIQRLKATLTTAEKDKIKQIFK